jgi:hypothetical protein
VFVELVLFIIVAIGLTPEGSDALLLVSTNRTKVGEGTLGGRGTSFMIAEQVKEKISPGLG